MNNYRVDRATDQRTPCGMNSILYIGDDISAARICFNSEHAGLDAWNKPNPEYGVLLSKWDSGKRDYVPLGFKDSKQSSYMEV